MTNFPGRTCTLYLAGARLLQAVPLVPLVAGVRLSLTALSYDGQFVVSLLGDDKCPICRFSPWAYAPHSRITFKPASRLPED